MRDPFRCFQGEFEPLRCDLAPSGENLCVRRAVVGVIDLDGRETLRVIGQHLRGGKLLGIKASPPLRIVIAGRTHPDRHTLVYPPALVPPSTSLSCVFVSKSPAS